MSSPQESLIILLQKDYQTTKQQLESITSKEAKLSSSYEKLKDEANQQQREIKHLEVHIQSHLH